MTPHPDLDNWSFYGREAEAGAIHALLERGRFFFLRVTGRRRIGKTTLVLQSLRESGRRVAYVQVADADPAGVVLGAREHLKLSGVAEPLPKDLFELAAVVGRLVGEGWVVVLDEYQAFARKPLYGFNSALQFEVDRLRAPGVSVSGGLIVLGSVQTEMEALLSGQRAPLFGRTTGILHLDHLEPSVTAKILTRHGRFDGPRWLFFWSLLQGIPKYWRDAYEVGALGEERISALTRLFFSGTSPLSAEGASWLVEELRGRYDPLLRYLARHPGASRADIAAHIAEAAGHSDPQVGSWLSTLEEGFRLVKRENPAFASPKARSGRYRIDDNFLVAWLGALADPVAFIGVQDTGSLVAKADERLATLEGFALERLSAGLYHERSRRGRGWGLTAPVARWWDRTGAEVDLVAQNRDEKRLRVGSCKRSADKLIADLPRFEGHLGRMLAQNPELKGWTVEKVAIAPALTSDQRRAIAAAGFVAEDLEELVEGL